MADDRGSPVVQIFADSETALRRMSRTAKTAECRITTASLIAAEADPVARAVPGAAILIELENEAAGKAAVPLLDWLQQEAERGTRRGVVSAPAGLIDLVVGSVVHADIEHLCAADETERLAAVVRAGRPTASRLQDAGRESSARLLQPAAGYAVDAAGRADAALIRVLIRVRRARAEHLPADLFADPAWDMLLDLMAARLEGEKVAVSSLCVAAAVPPTTALRWIGVLAERGLIVRTTDPSDRRRVHVELVGVTAQALLAWLRGAQRSAAKAL